MEQKISSDPMRTPVIQEIIISNRIGSISAEIAKRLNIEPTKALELFYESKACAALHNRNSDLYLLSDLYVVDEFLLEIKSSIEL